MTTSETAVSRCLKAYYDKAEIEDPHDTGVAPLALERVRLAYRHTMPYLLPDRDSIDAFIACVTHGLVIHVFEPAEASKLLYAAQVTLGSLRARAEAARQQSKSPPQQTKPTPPPPPLPRRGRQPQLAAPQANPQPSRAPSMATAPSSTWVGDHVPQPNNPSRAPSMATASPSSWVGDHEPQPTEPGATSKPQAPPPPSPSSRDALPLAS